jgi:membrane fusion protein (multidrug efflux system)
MSSDQLRRLGDSACLWRARRTSPSWACGVGRPDLPRRWLIVIALPQARDIQRLQRVHHQRRRSRETARFVHFAAPTPMAMGRESPLPAVTVERPSNVSVAVAELKRKRIPLVISGATLGLGLLGGIMVWYAGHKVNRTTMGGVPRPVSVIAAKASSFRDSRTYVGTIQAWVEADIGPQYISAYVQTVLVRPGDTVAEGAVVATLDCSNPSASTRAAAMQARSVDARQRALADESARVQSLLDGGFVAPNESEQKEALSDAEQAQLLEANAKLASASLDVKDCILRAPFAGEISARVIDPGAFVHPGTTIVSIVDRKTVRITADAPEKDFDVVQVGTAVTIDALSTSAKIAAQVSRRTPKADPGTRTIHFEVDVADPNRTIPVGTTGIIHIEVGQPTPASEVPAYAATVTDRKASLYVVEQGVAYERDVTVLGEVGGSLFVELAQLPAGTTVVTEGRALLGNKDRVRAKPDMSPPGPSRGLPTARGAGNARPK